MKQLLVKKAIYLSFITGLFSLSVGVVSCSSEDNEAPDTQERADGRKLRQLTISEVSLTRATLTEQTVGGKTSLGAAWKVGDQATYINLGNLGQTLLSYGDLVASSSAETSVFTGSVTCVAQDKIALIYPKVTPATGTGNFTINLTDQKGTLVDIAERYHYVYGVGEVTLVTGTTANATISSMKSLLAVCKFTFKDGNNNPISVNTLQISYGDDLSAGYPQTCALTPKVDPDEVFVSAILSPAGTPLTINLGSGIEKTNGVYVALFPVSGQNIFFSVTGSSDTDTYTGTATVNLKAGKYYYKELTLTKQ